MRLPIQHAVPAHPCACLPPVLSRTGRSRARASHTHDTAASPSFEHLILDVQRDIISGAEALDGSGRRFCHDRWERSPGHPNAGYGITSVLEGGDVLEKGAVNISIVGGVLSKDRECASSANLALPGVAVRYRSCCRCCVRLRCRADVFSRA